MDGRERPRPRLHPVPVERHLPPRAADAPHVRGDAAARHRRLRLADRPPLGALGGRLGPHLPGRPLGGRRRRRRRPRLPRPNELEPGPRHPPALVGVRGGLGRRPRHLGGDPAGAAAGAVVVRRSGNSIRLLMDAVAPGLLLAQGIGRWGNYWNQELYGTPTSLPWALRIDAAHQDGILPRYQRSPYGNYQPTFLYEFTWDLLGVGLLLWLDRRFRLRRPALFALYVVWYTTFRTYEEVLRIDPSNYLAGMRVNFWVSLGIWVLSVAFFVWWQFLRRPSPAPQPKARPVAAGPRMAVPKGRVR